VDHALAAGDPLALATLDGTGIEQAVYVAKPPNATTFFRIKVESPIP
jgi:hypothetical protein